MCTLRDRRLDLGALIEMAALQMGLQTTAAAQLGQGRHGIQPALPDLRHEPRVQEFLQDRNVFPISSAFCLLASNEIQQRQERQDLPPVLALLATLIEFSKGGQQQSCSAQ